MLPDLLRAWRAQAGVKSGRGRALPQRAVAQRMGVSERWYRSLESGDEVLLSADVLDRLAEALMLGPDERMALLGHALGDDVSPQIVTADMDLAPITRLVNMQTRLPAYVTDHAWNVVGHNARMAEWFPWVREPSANLLRWALRSAAAREQLVDWRANAQTYLAQLRFALVCSPADPKLNELLEAVLADPECRGMWDAGTRVVAYRQGHLYRLRLPWVFPDVFTVTTDVLIPAYLPGFRYVLVQPCEEQGQYRDRH